MSNLNQGHSQFADGRAIPVSIFDQAQHANVIQSDAEAIEVVERLAKVFAKEASLRDQERRLPVEEVQQYSQSGL